MEDLIAILGIGAILLVMGIMNLKGNIYTLHRYHRKRVKEEDVPAFGKVIGTGTIICAVSLMAFGALKHLADTLVISALSLAGAAVVIIGLTVGVAFMLYAMIKYNKGIF